MLSLPSSLTTVSASVSSPGSGARRAAATPRAKRLPNTIRPVTVHLRCTVLKRSMLGQALFCQAHSLPLAPSTNAITTPTTGISDRNETYTRLPSPHIQVRRNAPQFHRRISGGTTAPRPMPEVFDPGGGGGSGGGTPVPGWLVSIS
jgi:hypothetical protein